MAVVVMIIPVAVVVMSLIVSIVAKVVTIGGSDINDWSQ